MMIKNIPCILFAGGQSSRMGEDKALLPFGDSKTLTQYQYTRLSSFFKTIYISCKSADKFDFEARTIEDDKTFSVSAPTLGFYSALSQTDSEAIFVLSVDTPFITQAEIARLVLTFVEDDYDAVVAKTEEGIHPLCGVYAKRLLPKFEEMLKKDNHRLGQLLKNINTEFIFFEDEANFANLNHPHEYQDALAKEQIRYN